MVYLAIIFFVLVSGSLAVLAIYNFGNVSLNVGPWLVLNLPLGLLLLLAFILGACLLYLISAASARQDRRDLRRLSQRVLELEQGIATLSTSHYQPPQVQEAPAGFPIVPMPGMPLPPQQTQPPPDISDMPTLH